MGGVYQVPDLVLQVVGRLQHVDEQIPRLVAQQVEHRLGALDLQLLAGANEDAGVNAAPLLRHEMCIRDSCQSVGRRMRVELTRVKFSPWGWMKSKTPCLPGLTPVMNVGQAGLVTGGRVLARSAVTPSAISRARLGR